MSSSNNVQQPVQDDHFVVEQAAAPYLPDAPSSPHQSPQLSSPASTRDVDPSLDLTELTIPEDDGGPAWREAYILPRLKGEHFTEQPTELECSASVAESALQSAHVNKRLVFVEKWQRLGTIIKLRPGWIEERLAIMEPTWRKEYLRELERKGETVRETAASPVEDLAVSSEEDKGEGEVETTMSQRQSRLPRYKTAGTFVHIDKA